MVADFRQSLRSLRRNPAFTAAVVATLALGTGANSAIFSLIDAVLLKPLPYPDAKSIVELEDTYGNGTSPVVGPRMFVFWRQRNSVFQDVSAHWLDHLNLTGGDRPVLIAAGVASADFFRLYGAPVLYGRTFTLEEDRPGGGHVAVLGDRIWKDRYASDPAVIGKAISLGGIPYTVVGVLSPFDTEQFDQTPEVWVPFQIDPTGQDKDSRLCYVTARLKPGVTLATAQAESRGALDDYRRMFPSRVQRRRLDPRGPRQPRRSQHRLARGVA